MIKINPKVFCFANRINVHRKPKLQREHKLKREQSILLYPEGLITLNSSACEIISMCDGTRTISDIKIALYDKYKIIDELQLSNQIDRLLEDAYFKNWIELN
jgi:pyrroloquinoline quinone biosynthesis protein D